MTFTGHLFGLASATGMTNPARDMQENSKKQCVRSAKKYGMIRLGMSISISAAEHLFEFCDNKDKDGDGSRFMQSSRASR